MIQKTQFEKSQWKDYNFSQRYRDNADHFLPFRYDILDITIAIYKFSNTHNNTKKVLDLGCGDGLFMSELLKVDQNVEAILVDGSSEMLTAAEKRLADHQNKQFIKASFQEIISNNPLPKNFDFIFSSLAIHHLHREEKKRLYQTMYNILKPKGYFLNYDVTLSPTQECEKLNLYLWSSWLSQHKEEARKQDFLTYPQEYKDNKDNHPDTLEWQLEILKEIGFQNIECFFKFGIFSLFGGIHN